MGNKNTNINHNELDNIENINLNEIKQEKIQLISTGQYRLTFLSARTSSSAKAEPSESPSGFSA